MKKNRSEKSSQRRRRQSKYNPVDKFSQPVDAITVVARAGGPPLSAQDTMMMVPMLTEEDVIAAVCGYLSREDYRIDQRCGTTQHGVDIVATQPTSGVTIRIEAKGQTSNREESPRHGKEFSRGQTRVHVAAAVYTAIATNDAHPESSDRVAIAFPATKHHREFIGRIRATLKQLRIGVFWVFADRQVDLESPWS